MIKMFVTCLSTKGAGMVWWEQELGHAGAGPAHAEAYHAPAEDYSVPFHFLVADYSTER